MSKSNPSRTESPIATQGWTVVGAVLVLAITVATGILHGRQTHRWGPPQDLARAAANLQAFPRTVGSWEVTDEEELNQTVLETLHNPGYLVRSYQHRVTGDLVKLAVLVGAPGPIAVHTPEICYASNAYAVAGEPEAVSVGAEDAGNSNQFWKLELEPKGLSEPPLVVYYAWGTGEKWEAARNPRFTYGNKQLLYKLQLAAVRRLPAGDSGEDSGHRFLRDLLASDVQLPVAE